ncbi:hypothetical protein CMUS01_06717 [Colletotrichum musicola]|uniref:Uncharacterized protein n=1 Tax=Colletotrichum musicola TaxID=2175873 RepID=A0A8H6NHU3_9PEZI|nr:hypothetical protein CMUS01_06717 [Colletotrichum musicola]
MQPFSKLPPEIRDEILFHACLGRGLTRALRLKLVCKDFYQAVDLALFKTRFLDKNFHLDLWYFRQNFGFVGLFQAYISFRIRRPPLPDDGRIADLRSICDWLADETKTDLTLVIDALSKAAIGHIGMASSSDNERRKGTKYNDSEILYQKIMRQARFGAAIYLGHVHLAIKFMQEGCCPARDSHVLPSPMFLAAWAGRADMLKLLQEHLPEIEEVQRYQSHGGLFLDFRAKTGPGSIEGAAASGSLDMVRLAMFPPSRAQPDNFHFDPRQYGRLDTQPRLSACVDRALSTGSLEIYQYISSFYDPEERIRRGLQKVWKHLTYGHVDVVRYLVDQAVSINGGEWLDTHHLRSAASESQTEVVDLLLKRWGKPRLVYLSLGPAILTTADVGSLSILRKLLQHYGADVPEHFGREILKSAVRREHVAMVRLLLDRGVCDAKFHAGIADMALEEGLESMADLLRGERVAG